ncbi:APC family permease [Streptomyces sp. NRRL S-1813]|uniref:APC family permease n=1 Tax=Streptomyces sp. NRRL S-1813 TaxID=1463888 RepID=UPI0004CB6830|nr:APC family permease [Streptomyces sp. NRRL S-1813]
MTTDTTAGPALHTGALGARHVVFFVVAAAAPLGFSVGALPLAIGRGGVGTAGMFLVCGAIFTVLAVGYVAMARRIRSAGGLYLFVAEGIGRPLGLGVAFVAVLSYGAAATGAVGLFAVFARNTVDDLFHVSTPWLLWALIATAAMAVLGLLRVELNARVLGVVIVGELAILVIVALAVTARGGAHGLSAAAFSPGEVFGPRAGVMLAAAVAAFGGFESTVLFSEEVRDPARTIRRATFAAIAVLAVFYAFITWSIVQAFGDAGAVTVGSTDPTGMMFTAARDFAGGWVATTMQVLVVTSWFASILAFHNAASRYVFALGRDGVLPKAAGAAHPRLGSPWVASAGHSLLTLAAVLACAASGSDPYEVLFVLGSAPAVIGLPLMNLLAAFGIFTYFLRNRHGLPAWQVLLCPLLAGLALLAANWLIIANTPQLTGRDDSSSVLLPLLVLAALVAGCVRGAWLWWRQPAVYAAIGQTDPLT